MGESTLGRFFGVVTRPQTWLNVLYQWLAFPLGLFYFIFLSVGLSLGLGLIVVWVGIPILLVVAGAWWLFGSLERLQAHYLLGADVGPAPRSWETVDGVWAKLKAHFGNGATWKDLVYLFAKLPLGIVSFTLAVTATASVGWLLALPIAWLGNVDLVTTSSGGWSPPWWLGILGVPAGILMSFVWLHVLNAWGWVCARWAELLLRGDQASGGWQTELDQAQPAPSQPAPSQPAPSLAAGQPVVPPAAPQSEPSAAPQPPEPPAAPQPPVS